MSETDATSPAWQPSRRQVERTDRSKAILARYQAPTYTGPLFVDDDEEAIPRAASEVARRTLALWAVVLRAEGMPQTEVLDLLVQMKVREAVSPEEDEFLGDPDPDAETSQSLVWRLESIWVLLWALGHLTELDWPRGMCDVARIVEIIKPRETDPDFINRAVLRPVSELLDAQDLTLRIHWAIRDVWINQGGFLPADLDWSKDYELAHVSGCAAVGVVEQRHHTLNWLFRFGEAEWDDVDTPT